MQAEDGIRYAQESRGLGDVYKRQGRECRDLVTQISAANRALERTGFRLVSAGMTYCISNPDKAEAEGYPIDEVEKMFLRLA